MKTMDNPKMVIDPIHQNHSKGKSISSKMILTVLLVVEKCLSVDFHGKHRQVDIFLKLIHSIEQIHLEHTYTE